MKRNCWRLCAHWRKLQDQRGSSKGKTGRFAVAHALPASSRAIQVNCADTYPSSFALRDSDSRLCGWALSAPEAVTRDPAQHRREPSPRQVSFRQHQPVIPRMRYQSSARLHQPLLQARQRPCADSLRQHQPPPQVTQAVCDHAQPQPPEPMHKYPAMTSEAAVAFITSRREHSFVTATTYRLLSQLVRLLISL